LATRAEIIRKNLIETYPDHKEKWYLSEALWDAILSAVNVIAKILGLAGRPIASATLDTVVQTARAPKETTLTKVEALYKALMHEISQKLAIFDKASIEYHRADAQLELLGRLMNQGEAA
jgi:hypothetical protein